jgi:Flp pilus assembly protein TadG
MKAGSGCGGNAAVEFALIAPALLFLLAAAIDLGRDMYYTGEVLNAVRVGQQYALSKPSDTSGTMLANIRNAAMLATDLNPTTLVSPVVTVATPTLSCECNTTPSPTAIACGTTPTCSTGSVKRQMMTITGTYTFKPLFPINGMLPFVTSVNGTITESVTFQLS